VNYILEDNAVGVFIAASLSLATRLSRPRADFQTPWRHNFRIRGSPLVAPVVPD